jgi:NADH-quinone oxidoreductase subunit H
VISYEIAMGLSWVAVFLYAGSLSTTAIVSAQHTVWYILPLLPSFLIYLVTMVGETNRVPFDLPEGEGEIVAGHMTEYSSMKFAMFFLAEYINMTTLAALATTMFLGGWRAPVPLSLIPGANSGWLPVLWFLIKVFLLLFGYVWLRGTLPRTRYDQLMSLGWKILIPLAIVWLLLTATIRLWKVDGLTSTVVGVGILVILLLVLMVTFWDNAAVRRTEAHKPEPPAPEGDDGLPVVEGFPVPPMDRPHYHGLDLDAPLASAGALPSAGAATAKEVTGA